MGPGLVRPAGDSQARPGPARPRPVRPARGRSARPSPGRARATAGPAARGLGRTPSSSCWRVPREPLRPPRHHRGPDRPHRRGPRPPVHPRPVGRGRPGLWADARVPADRGRVGRGRAGRARALAPFFLDSRDTAFGTRSDPTGAAPSTCPCSTWRPGGPGRWSCWTGSSGSPATWPSTPSPSCGGGRPTGWRPPAAGRSTSPSLTGFRYLDLQGVADPPDRHHGPCRSTQDNQFDRFATANRFYGGQVGGRATATSGRWFAGLTAPRAVGATESVVDVSGVSRQTGRRVRPPRGVPRGHLHPAVEHRPAVGVGVLDGLASGPPGRLPGVWVPAGVRRVRRPVLDPVGPPAARSTRSSTPPRARSSSGNGVLSGPAHPAPAQSRTDFCVQGFTAGLEFRY